MRLYSKFLLLYPCRCTFFALKVKAACRTRQRILVMKFIIKSILGLIILAVIALVALPLVLNPNDFKPQITTKVEQLTGRSFALDGDIGLTYFPWLGLELNGVKLGNAPGFGEKSFAEIAKARVRVKLMQLLKKELSVDTLILQGLKLHLTRDKSGKGNWEDLASKAQTSQAPSEVSSEAKTTATSSPGEPPLIAALMIGGLNLEDAELRFEDQQAGSQIQLEKLNLHTGTLVPGKPVALELKSQVSLMPQNLNFSTQLKGTAAFDEANNRLTIPDLQLGVTEAKAQQNLELKGQLELDTKLQLLNIRDLAIKAQMPRQPGDKTLVELDLKSQLAASLSQLRLSLAPLDLKLGYAGNAQQLIAKTKLNADLTQGLAVLDSLEASLGELKIKGQIQASNLKATPKLAGNLALSPFNPRSVMKSLNLALPATADPVALSKGALSFSLDGTPTKINLKNLKLTLDDTAFSGSLGVAMGAKPMIDFNLSGSSLDLNRYLPPASAPSAAAKNQPEAPLALAALFIADLKGSLGLGKLKVQQFQMDNLSLKIEQKNGLLKMDQSIGNFYQGKYQGNLQLNAAAKPPSLAFKANINGVQAQPLVKAIAGEDRLSGKGDATLDLRSQGQTVTALRKALTGNVTFKFSNGAIKGFNIGEIIRDAKSRIAELKGEEAQAAATGAPLETDFSELSATAKLQGMVIDNTSLSLKAPYLRFEGQGQMDTEKSWLNYKLTTVIIDNHKGQGGKDYKKLGDIANIPIPMSYKGSLDQVSDWRKWTIHFDKIIEAKLKQRLDEEKEKLKDKAKEELQKRLDKELEKKGGEKLKDALKKLF